jgi:hypothetical protein
MVKSAGGRQDSCEPQISTDNTDQTQLANQCKVKHRSAFICEICAVFSDTRGNVSGGQGK